MSRQFVDLRTLSEHSLLEFVYRELYLTTFIDPSEQEDLEQYRTRLYDPQLPPPQPITHFVVAGESLDDVAARRVDGFVIFESYRHSGCGLVTYLVVAPSGRGQGLGRELLNRACEVLASDMDRWHERAGALRAIFAETHDPALVNAQQDTMDPVARIDVMRKLGATQVPIRYVQPELQIGAERSRQLLMIRFPRPGENSQSPLSASAVLDFLHEFYRALGVSDPDHDADYLAIVDDVRRATDDPRTVVKKPVLPVCVITNEEVQG